MKRREVLAGAGVALTGVSGCIGNTPETTNGGENSTLTTSRGEDSTHTTDGEENSTLDLQLRQQFTSCEEHYIRTELIEDNEQIDGSVDPSVIESDTRDTGVYAEVRTTFAAIRSSEGAPDLHVDYKVTAYYFKSGNETFRTEDADRDPKNGSQIQCG